MSINQNGLDVSDFEALVIVGISFEAQLNQDQVRILDQDFVPRADLGEEGLAHVVN